ERLTRSDVRRAGPKRGFVGADARRGACARARPSLGIRTDDRRGDAVRRAAYCEAALAHRPVAAESERLTGRARAGEAAMLALRTAEGVETTAFAERY